jgi:hypothetical protein
VRGIWDLIVACKGSAVVAWRQGSLRTGLVGVLAAVAMVGAVGGLWISAGDDGVSPDAAAPGGGAVARDDGIGVDGRIGMEGGAAGPRSPGAPGGTGLAADTTQDGDAGSLDAVAPGAVASGGRPSPATTVAPDDGALPSPSAPGTTGPEPGGTSTTTTTGAVAPPDGSGGSDGTAPGGLLGGVLDLLGVGG